MTAHRCPRRESRIRLTLHRRTAAGSRRRRRSAARGDSTIEMKAIPESSCVWSGLGTRASVHRCDLHVGPHRGRRERLRADGSANGRARGPAARLPRRRERSRRDWNHGVLLAVGPGRARMEGDRRTPAGAEARSGPVVSHLSSANSHGRPQTTTSPRRRSTSGRFSHRCVAPHRCPASSATPRKSTEAARVLLT